MKWTKHLLVLAAAFSLPAAATAELPKLISRDILFGNPEKTAPRISPDGKYLSWLAPDGKDVLQVWVQASKPDARPEMVTADKKRGIRQYFWAFDGKQLIYAQDVDGDENYHLFAVDVQSKQVRDLTPFQGVRAQLVALDPDHPNEMLVGMNLKSRAKFDVYRVNLTNGAVELDTENPGNVVGWTADADLKVRAATASTKEGGYELLFRDAPGKEWKGLRRWTPDEQGSAVGFSRDGKTLYVSANHDADTIRLLALDLASGKESVLAEDKEYDLSGAMVHPTRRTVEAVVFNRDRPTWKILDKSIEADFAALEKVREGEFNVVSRDLEDKTWVVAYSSDDGPTYYYTYDRGARKSTLLFSSQPKLEGLPLVKMKPISFKARDGLTIHGYLSLPLGVPAKNLPAVLLVHGGPWARDSWGFNPMHQWLANRGYAVLSVNFRGSAGYGKKFLNAGNREWGGKMHLDLIDAVDWLVKEGIANPKKVGIMGGSYGGYATLVGLTFTPEVFACGVDIVGPSNLITLLKTIPPYWAPLRAMFARRVGDLEKDEEFLKERSPLFKVDRIRAPLLIGQGANDPRVKQAESDQIYEALKKANKPVTYVIYSDEGHGFARPENRLHFFAVAEEFLSRHLEGRAEPMGEIKGHSATIKN